jgi:hypothetical protein
MNILGSVKLHFSDDPLDWITILSVPPGNLASAGQSPGGLSFRNKQTFAGTIYAHYWPVNNTKLRLLGWALRRNYSTRPKHASTSLSRKMEGKTWPPFP